MQITINFQKEIFDFASLLIYFQAQTIHKILDADKILLRPGVTLLRSVKLPEDFKIIADCKRISQIIQNLISNAAKFTEFGSIEFFCEKGEEKDGMVDLHFELKDSGIGMTQEVLSKIFKPYTQVQFFFVFSQRDI